MLQIRIPEAICRGKFDSSRTQGTWQRCLPSLALFALPARSPAPGPQNSKSCPAASSVRMLDAEGHPENRAGSHPDRFEIDFALQRGRHHGEGPRSSNFPPGFGGNPGAVQECSRARSKPAKKMSPGEPGRDPSSSCSEERGSGHCRSSNWNPARANSSPSPRKPHLEAPLKTELRPSDFGITLKAERSPRTDASSEGRCRALGRAGGSPGWDRDPAPADADDADSVWSARLYCSAPAPGRKERLAERERDTEAPLEGCADLAFGPSLALRLSNPVADSPTGVQMELTTPEEDEGERTGRRADQGRRRSSCRPG